jgi:hypothetical protein
MAGTGSYYILCIEYTLHYTVTSLTVQQKAGTFLLVGSSLSVWSFQEKKFDNMLSDNISCDYIIESADNIIFSYNIVIW